MTFAEFKKQKSLPIDVLPNEKYGGFSSLSKVIGVLPKGSYIPKIEVDAASKISDILLKSDEVRADVKENIEKEKKRFLYDPSSSVALTFIEQIAKFATGIKERKEVKDVLVDYEKEMKKENPNRYWELKTAGQLAIGTSEKTQEREWAKVNASPIEQMAFKGIEIHPAITGMKFVTPQQASQMIAKAGKIKLTRSDLIKITKGELKSGAKFDVYKTMASNPAMRKELTAIAKNTKVPLKTKIADYLKGLIKTTEVTKPTGKAITGKEVITKAKPSVSKGLEPLAKEATFQQIKQAHILAREKLLLSEKTGKTKPQYRTLAKGITGKTSMKEMTQKEAGEFIDALKKIKTRIVGGKKLPPKIPITQRTVTEKFFDKQFKKPSLIKYITPSNRYAMSLGAYDLIEPSIKAKTAMEIERAAQFKNLNKIEKRIYKIEKIKIPEKVKTKITATPPKAIQKWYDMLDKYATSKEAGLTGEPAKIFDGLRGLTKGMLERTNEIRAKVDLPPINSIRAYITHLKDLATKKELAKRFSISEAKKYWSDFVRSKHIYNPTALHRMVKEPETLLKDPIKALRAMVSVDLKQIYLEQPTLLYREQMRALQDIIPATTRKWLDSYMNIVIRGRPTELDELTNASLEKLGVDKALNLVLKPFGKQPSYNLSKSISGAISKVIHDALIWGKMKLVIRNHTQKFLSLGLYGSKPWIKASFPASKELKQLIKDSDFWKISNRSFMETEVAGGKGLISKLRKLGYKPYGRSHISNVTHAQKTAYYAAKDLVDNPKYKKLGWTNEDALREMEFGAMTTQYWYNLMGMPEIYRSGTGRVLATLNSWWMNYTTNYWRELLVRGFKGKTGWGKSIPVKWRIAALRHIVSSILFIEGSRRALGLDYRQVALLGVLPTYLSPPGQILLGLYNYLTAGDNKYKKSRAVNQMKYSWKAFIPGGGAWKEWSGLWSGEKTIKETLFYTDEPTKKTTPSTIKIPSRR